MSRIFRTVIVDDEALARARLRRLLSAHADVEIVAECGDGRTAIAEVKAHRPDLVFLDVQMPEVDGFAVLAALGTPSTAAVVLVTAYQRYAAPAFDADVVEYLVKPFDAARLARALGRVRQRADGQALGPRLEALLAAVSPAAPARLPVRVGERIELLNLDEIDYLVAEGNYVAIHASGHSYLIRETLTALELRLDPRHFVRIHRSRLVRIDRVRAIDPLFHGEYRLTLHDGTHLTSARGYRDALRAALGL